MNATHEPGPQDDLGRHDEQRAVRELLGKMRPAYAQVLLLRHEGLSYSDIAEATGLSRNSVGTMLLRAERQFVKLHNQAGGEEV
ncbi:MAG: sigma factor-like helix-turn-helix DNA-binding protein [Chloroflexia bacterium]